MAKQVVALRTSFVALFVVVFVLTLTPIFQFLFVPIWPFPYDFGFHLRLRCGLRFVLPRVVVIIVVIVDLVRRLRESFDAQVHFLDPFSRIAISESDRFLKLILGFQADHFVIWPRFGHFCSFNRLMCLYHLVLTTVTY